MPAFAPPPRAARPVQGAHRNPAIDALRGISILCVVLLHVQIHIPQEQSLLGKVLPPGRSSTVGGWLRGRPGQTARTESLEAPRPSVTVTARTEPSWSETVTSAPL